MVNLKREKIDFPVNDKVKLVHYLTKDNSLFDYIEAEVYEMAAGGELSGQLLEKEACIVLLTGHYDVIADNEKFENIGTRQSVFEKIPTDSVYVPNTKSYQVNCREAGKVLIAKSPTTETNRKVTFIPASDNSREHRGKYNNQRTVHNILDDQSPISEKLLLVEVYTEQANWSSFPPHRHDRNNLPEETYLEEAYYHEVRGEEGFVFQRIYSDDLLLDETMTVYNGEMVQVPRGYHPVAVPDGYESYYLNIMAGPRKLWRFHNAPEHAWIIDRP